MPEAWTRQITAIERGPIDVVVHVGAGEGIDAAVIAATSARRIVLVEPNPRPAGKLQRHFADDERVTVVQAAIAIQDGQALLHVLNFAGLSSLRPQCRLGELFPGVREVATEAVKTRGVAWLCSEFFASHEENGLLIIDAPGEEGVIVDGLLALGDNARVRHVILRCGSEAYFDGGAAAQDLVGLLEAAGYRLEWQSTEDPDFPVFHLILDPLADEITRLNEVLATNEAETQQLRSRLAELKSDLEKALESHEAEVQRSRSRIAELESKLEAALEASRSEAEHHKRRVAEFEADANQRATADIALALRLQHMAEKDRHDLQGRFAELLQIKEGQDNLLRTLTQRLGAAAQYLEKIDADPRMQSLDGPPSKSSADLSSHRRARAAPKKKNS